MICLLVLTLSFSPIALKDAQAFDTGHHFDLTRVALKREGFAVGAIDSILLASWLTDYYSNAPSSNNLLLRSALNRLHFDNLRTPKEVENYYRQFLKNLHNLTLKLANKRRTTLSMLKIHRH